MFKYILKRIGLMILTFIIIFLMCFVLIKLLPVSVDIQVGKDLDIIMNQLEARGYFDPIPTQLINYMKRIIYHGDWGIGVNLAEYRNREVWGVFVEKLPPTVLINFYSALIAVPIGISLGILAALKKNKWQDHTISTSVMLFISVPSFVYAFLVQYLLCFKLRLFDITMIGGYNYFNWNMFKSMFPAVISLSFGSIAGYARLTRAELTEVLTSEFMLLARTKGLTRSQATVRHALRNSMVPIFPAIIAEFIYVLSGSLIIENIFGVPGVGGLYLASINAQDYDFFMLLSAFYTIVGLAAGIVIDISYGFIDPRIRMGAK
jgi:ABC-type dipeptide/oligopeptide/nickel transport system permease component